MPSSDLKEYSVRLTAMQMLIQKLQNLAFLFNSDGTTTFYAELEKSSASQKEYLEKIQEKKAAEKKEIKKKGTIQANRSTKKLRFRQIQKEELLDKIKKR